MRALNLRVSGVLALLPPALAAVVIAHAGASIPTGLTIQAPPAGTATTTGSAARYDYDRPLTFALGAYQATVSGCARLQGGIALVHPGVVSGVAAEDAAGGASIRDINPGGGRLNCGQCALAVDKLLAGEPVGAVAADGGATLVADLEVAAGGTFGSATTAADLASEIADAGPGARGIVFGSRGPGRLGHFFNVVNQDGTVRFLDGQTGTAANLNNGYLNFFLLRTN